MSDDPTLEQILAVRRGAAAAAVVDVDVPMVKLVVFTLDDGWYAFAADRIAEVLPDCPVYFLPGCPPSLEGVIHVRGDVESVIRLRVVLGLTPAAAGAPSRILIGQGAAMRSGLRVDSVEDVIDVVADSIQAPPNTIAESLKPLVRGIATVRGHLVTVLDLDRLFTDYRAGLG